MAVRVYLVDDSPRDLDRLRRLLAPDPDIKVVGEVADAQAALAEIEELQPDVVLMDLGLPGMGGHYGTLHISRTWPKIAVIIVSWTADPLVVNQAFKSGAMGYLDKRALDGELLRAVHVVAERIPWLGDDVRSFLLQDQDHLDDTAGTPADRLTPRLKQVLHLVARGLETKEIADLLDLSERTVSGHRCKIVKLLGARNMHNAVALAARWLRDEAEESAG